MKNYQEVKDNENNVVCIFEPTIGSIPLDLGNRDYQAYLRWLENPNAEQIAPTLP